MFQHQPVHNICVRKEASKRAHDIYVLRKIINLGVKLALVKRSISIKDRYWEKLIIE